jgi:hypothetical protein
MLLSFEPVDECLDAAGVTAEYCVGEFALAPLSSQTIRLRTAFRV